MQDYNLKNPGIDQASQNLRKAAAHAISSLENVVSLGATPDVDLSAFFSDAASKTPGYTGPLLPATQAVVANGGNVTVKNSAGTVTKTGVATVAANAITGVALPAASAIIDNAAANVVVQNSAGAAVSSAGLAAVAAGALTSVRLPATIAAVATGVKINAGTVSGTGNFATITVANGVITGIVLSAS
jgi:hypothetical protein